MDAAPLIKTIKEIAVERALECQREVGELFKKSVGIVYGYDDTNKFIAYGSCVFLEHLNERYLITAAHVIDEAQKNGFSITGAYGFVQVAGEFRATTTPKGNRLDDKHDFAFLRLTPELLADIGSAAVFVRSAEVSKNRGSNHGRQFLVLGFPGAKNTKLINRVAKSVSPQPWSYLSMFAEIEDEIMKKTGLTSEVNLAVKFDEKRIGDASGKKVNAPDPHGVSGGALVDLGLPHPDKLSPEVECTGRLAGIMMEVHKGQKVLAAVRIEHVLAAIEADLSRLLSAHADPQ